MTRVIASAFLLFTCLATQAQDNMLIDKIIGVVGNEIILLSELEIQTMQMSEEAKPGPEFRCVVLEDLLFQKLLLNQARLDSIEVGESEIQGEIDRRLAYYYGLLGGKEAFEAYYGKTESQWREDFHDPIEEQIMAEKAKGSLFGNVTVTPAEVLSFYNSIPSDSLPLMNEQLEYSQIIVSPVISNKIKNRTRFMLDSIRLDLIAGKSSMTIQAAKWSEDPGSKYKGGCYPLQKRKTFVPEYEAAVFNTPEGSYSPVFETVYGNHFVYVKEKRGEYYEACHILMSAKAEERDFDKSKQKIDSISHLISGKSINFKNAAIAFSDDEKTSNQEGRVINKATGSTSFDVTEVDPSIFFVLDKIDPESISEPVLIDVENGQKAWAIFKLDKRRPAHKANLKDDYLIFQNRTQAKKQQELLDGWVKKRLNKTYARVSEEYLSCPFSYRWMEEVTLLEEQPE